MALLKTVPLFPAYGTFFIDTGTVKAKDGGAKVLFTQYFVKMRMLFFAPSKRVELARVESIVLVPESDFELQATDGALIVQFFV
jgi:hypothetical protein